MEKSSDGTEPKEIMEIKAYIYMKYENMLKVLAGGALKVRSIDECNDPYEQMPAGPEGKERAEEYDMAFICFSSYYNSSTMWAHYGDKHKGVCLEFTFPLRQPALYPLDVEDKPPYYILDIELEEDSPLPFIWRMEDGTYLHYCVLFNMKHKKKRQAFDYGMVGTSTMGNRLICNIDECLVTKDESWRYEGEQRILIPLPEKAVRKEEDYFVDCFHKYLTGIILGIKCRKDAESVKKIVELFREDGDGPIQVYKAQYSEETFDVRVPGIDKAPGNP